MARTARPSDSDVHLGSDAEAGADMGLDLPGGVGAALRALFSELSKGSRGKIATETLARLGYAEDPEALRDAYQAHSGAIEAYFNQIDTRALLKAVMEAEGEEGAVAGLTKRDGVAAAAGSGMTLLLQQVLS
jgi:hypothetical protein